MASSLFLKLALICIDHFAWPLVALCYPLCASVQAIETDSYEETRDLNSYWIILSLIYLFEYAFLRLLQPFQFWPYIKLMITFWLIIPDFGRASYVYANVIRPCFFVKPQALISWLNNWTELFVKEEDFLLHAERYIEENGTEALESLIASKTNGKRFQRFQALNKDIKDFEVTDTNNEEMRETNAIGLQIEHKDIKDLVVIDKEEVRAGIQNSLSKLDAHVRNTIEITDNREMQETNGKRFQRFQALDKDIKDFEVTATNNEEMRETNAIGLQIEHKDLEDLVVIDKDEVRAGKQDKAKAIAGKDKAVGEHAESSSSTHKEVQKCWTCG